MACLPEDSLHTLVTFIEHNRGKPRGVLAHPFLQRVVRKLRKIAGREINRLDPMLLGFRIYIVLRMHEILNADAGLLATTDLPTDSADAKSARKRAQRAAEVA